MDDDEGARMLVYAQAGLALFRAHVFEEGLGWLLQACALAEGDIDSEEQRRILEESLRAKTLGGLLRLVRNKLVFSPEAEALINQALADRNALAHDFFKDYGLEWFHDAGRMEMILKLAEYEKRFIKANRVIQAHGKAVYREMGMTEEKLREMKTELFKNAGLKEPP